MIGDQLSAGDQEHGLHWPRSQQAQLYLGRGDQGPLQVLGVQGEVPQE